MDSINFDSKMLFECVQVNPRILEDGTGDFKFQVIGFKILDDIPSAKGITNANPQLGAGGLEQIFTPDFKNLIREGKVEPILDPNIIKKLEENGIAVNKELLQHVDGNGNYKYKSVCEIVDNLIEDPNIIKLKNYEISKIEVEMLKTIIDSIKSIGGGIN